MRAFISWSKPYSQQIALALRDWLPTVVPGVEPWVSSEDIEKGSRWNPELNKELDASRFGIICLVPENLREPWIVFEAGAMARSLETARVAPFLVGVAIKDVPGPLAQFQCTVFEKEDVRKLVHSINRASSTPIETAKLNQVFEDRWPALAERIREIEKSHSQGNESSTPRVGALVRERTPSLAALPADALSEEQVEILTMLARNPRQRPTAAMIASLMNVAQTRAEYYLDGLKNRRLIHNQLYAGSPATYYLTEAGRAYAVEYNLV